MKKRKLWLGLIVILIVSASMLYLSFSGRIEQKIDTDGDRLPDVLEAAYGTRIDMRDTDGDGINDYWEAAKYKTDPLKKDSDGDGIPDSDWEERREYTYTIQAVIDLRPPFNVEHMNDFYQDANKMAGVRIIDLNVTIY